MAALHGLVAMLFERYVAVAGNVRENIFGKGGDSKADARLLPCNHIPSEPFGSRNEKPKRSVLGFWTSKNEARESRLEKVENGTKRMRHHMAQVVAPMSSL